MSDDFPGADPSIMAVIRASLPPVVDGNAPDLAPAIDAVMRARVTLCGIEQPAAVAAQWVAEGFDAAGIVAWGVDGGCFWPQSARELRDAGVTPQQAAQLGGMGLSRGQSIGYSYANGDMPLVYVLAATRQ